MPQHYLLTPKFKFFFDQNLDFALGSARKTALTPKQPMKALWWTRFVAPENDVDSVWLHVNDEEFVEDDFVLLFSKKQTEVKVASKKKEKKLECLRVVTDPQLVVGKEAALRGMPAPAEVHAALMSFDDHVLNSKQLEALLDNVIPTAEQTQQLNDLRLAHPEIPFANPEQYMFELSTKENFFKNRVQIWVFLNSYFFHSKMINHTGKF